MEGVSAKNLERYKENDFSSPTLGRGTRTSRERGSMRLLTQRNNGLLKGRNPWISRLRFVHKNNMITHAKWFPLKAYTENILFHQLGVLVYFHGIEIELGFSEASVRTSWQSFIYCLLDNFQLLSRGDRVSDVLLFSLGEKGKGWGPFRERLVSCPSQ